MEEMMLVCKQVYCYWFKISKPKTEDLCKQIQKINSQWHKIVFLKQNCKNETCSSAKNRQNCWFETLNRVIMSHLLFFH